MNVRMLNRGGIYIGAAARCVEVAIDMQQQGREAEAKRWTDGAKTNALKAADRLDSEIGVRCPRCGGTEDIGYAEEHSWWLRRDVYACDNCDGRTFEPEEE